MKKIILGLCAVASVALTSCDPGETGTTVKRPNAFFAYNLITPLDGSAPTAVEARYGFELRLPQYTGDLAGEFKYAGVNYVFQTVDSPFIQYGYYVGDNTCFDKFTGNMNNSPALPIKDSYFYATTNYVHPYAYKYKNPDNDKEEITLDQFYPNKEDYANPAGQPSTVKVTPMPGVLFTPSSGIPSVVVARYTVGEDFRVNTFLTDQTYQGTTHTSVPPMGGSTTSTYFTSKTMFYRIVLDLENKTACAVIYNAKFAENMTKPLRFVYIKGLTLEYRGGGFALTGTDLPAYAPEGDKVDINPNYTFKQFTMTTYGQDMVGARINYTVETSRQGIPVDFTGNFDGNTVIMPSTGTN